MRNRVRVTIAALVFFAACHSGTDSSDTELADASRDNLTLLTREQMENQKIRLGSPEARSFQQNVRATGYLVPMVGSSAEINSLVPGRIRKIRVSEGQPVGKGSALIQLEGEVIVTMQQEYISVRNDLEVLKSAYERLRSLKEGNVASQREFQQAERDYLTRKAEKDALEIRLRLLNIDPREVAEGQIAPFISVRAPIRGVVTHMHTVLGQYVHPGDILMELVDPSRLRIKLQVFEKDLTGLAEGQKVRFSLPGTGSDESLATLESVGRSIDSETRSITCYAQMEEELSVSFGENSYVEATIITCEREALSIPEEAILREGDLTFVWQLVSSDDLELGFRKIPVRVGPTFNGFTEILDTGLSDLVIQGASLL